VLGFIRSQIFVAVLVAFAIRLGWKPSGNFRKAVGINLMGVSNLIMELLIKSYFIFC